MFEIPQQWVLKDDGDLSTYRAGRFSFLARACNYRDGIHADFNYFFGYNFSRHQAQDPNPFFGTVLGIWKGFQFPAATLTSVNLDLARHEPHCTSEFTTRGIDTMDEFFRIKDQILMVPGMQEPAHRVLDEMLNEIHERYKAGKLEPHRWVST